MVTVIRATQKVLKFLPRSGDSNFPSANLLGDWYVNRLVVDRRPLLLMVSAHTRLAIIQPARDLKRLPATLPEVVRRRLEDLGIPASAIARELELMNPISVGPTLNRSIVGQMVDFAKAIPYYLPEGDWGEPDLKMVEERLGETPCLCSGKSTETIWPEREAHRLLVEKCT